MQHDFAAMSVTEQTFFRAYTAAVTRNYDPFVTAIMLFRSRTLGDICPARATTMADQLCDMHDDYEQRLCDVFDRNNDSSRLHVSCKLLPPIELMTLIRSSFFRLISSTTHEDAGWFSGHPLDPSAVQNAKLLTGADSGSSILNAFTKFTKPKLLESMPNQISDSELVDDYADYDDENDYEEPNEL